MILAIFALHLTLLASSKCEQSSHLGLISVSNHSWYMTNSLESKNNDKNGDNEKEY